jgi:two-component sensor histidine kinase
VRDGGGGPSAEALAAPGLGLTLVRQVVTNGLHGTLQRDVDGGVRIDFFPDADPRR